MYLVRSGHNYVKALDGKPIFRSTPDPARAARFATEAEARAWAPKVFAGSMLAAVEVVEEALARDFGPVNRATGRPFVDRFNDEPNMPWDH